MKVWKKFVHNQSYGDMQQSWVKLLQPLPQILQSSWLVLLRVILYRARCDLSLEIQTQVAAVQVHCVNKTQLECWLHFKSYKVLHPQKLIGVTAMVLRAAWRLKSAKRVDQPPVHIVDECEQVEALLMKIAQWTLSDLKNLARQINHFCDEQGLWCCCGQLASTNIPVRWITYSFLQESLLNWLYHCNIHGYAPAVYSFLYVLYEAVHCFMRPSKQVNLKQRETFQVGTMYLDAVFTDGILQEHLNGVRVTLQFNVPHGGEVCSNRWCIPLNAAWKSTSGYLTFPWMSSPQHLQKLKWFAILPTGLMCQVKTWMSPSPVTISYPVQEFWVYQTTGLHMQPQW